MEDGASEVGGQCRAWSEPGLVQFGSVTSAFGKDWEALSMTS